MAKIKIHVETVHKKLRKFKCQLCVADDAGDKNGSPHEVPTFLTKGHLDSHIDSFHKQLRPHVCHMCGLAFARAYNLKCHLKKTKGASA